MEKDKDNIIFDRNGNPILFQVDNILSNDEMQDNKIIQPKNKLHKKAKGFDRSIFKGMDGLTYEQARGVEQMLIDRARKSGFILTNILSGISEKNPKREIYMEAANEFIKIINSWLR